MAGCRVCNEYTTRRSGVSALVLRLSLREFRDHNLFKASQSADCFFRHVNAILNSSRYKCLCIHAENLHYFDNFCQKVDDRLVSLIPDDTLFHHNFHSWFYDQQHLVFRFKDRSRDRGWSTFDFNTTVSLNKGREGRLAHSQFRKFMELVKSPCAQRNLDRNRNPSFILNDEVTFLDRSPFQECAYHQAKDRFYFRMGLGGDTLAHLLWDDCELGSYISALSKVSGGGSVYFGIEENRLPGGEKKFGCKGIALTLLDFENLKTELHQKLINSMTWRGLSSVQSIVPVDICCRTIAHEDVVFYDLFVVEVVVKYFQGICFHDADGPASFKFEGNTPSPVNVLEWIDQNDYTVLERFTAGIDGREVRIRCVNGAGDAGAEGGE